MVMVVIAECGTTFVHPCNSTSKVFHRRVPATENYVTIVIRLWTIQFSMFTLREGRVAIICFLYINMLENKVTRWALAPTYNGWQRFINGPLNYHFLLV